MGIVATDQRGQIRLTKVTKLEFFGSDIDPNKSVPFVGERFARCEGVVGRFGVKQLRPQMSHKGTKRTHKPSPGSSVMERRRRSVFDSR